MAEQVASLFGELTLQDNYTVVLNNATTATDTFTGKIERAGAKMSGFGATLGTFIDPAVSALESAAGAAFDFNESMTDTQAIMGATGEEIKNLSSEILDIGRNSRAGPQAVAEAFTNIVGSVNDVSQQMPILNEAIATAEAGNADLLATTKALTSTMNSYAGSTLTVSQASDIMTRTVGMGVGSMEEFASALPQVTGLANSLKISFLDIGTAAAFLTTKGNTASQATTQLGAIMNAFMGPNETMKKALEELGFASGNAAIEQLGLVGAIDAIKGTAIAGDEGLLRLLGTQEALRGVTSLAGADFKQFAADYAAGVEGATGAAREIQNMSEAANLDFLKSEFAALKIEAGMGLAPALVEVVQEARPLVRTFTDFVKKNPKVVAAVGLVVGGLAAVAAVATVVGLGITGLGMAFGAVAAVLGSPLLIPIAGVIAVLGGLYAAWKSNFGGIQDLVMPIINQVKTGFEGLGTFIDYFAESFKQNGLIGMFREMFTATVDGQTSIEWLFNAFGLGAENSKKLADAVNEFGNAALDTLVGDVLPALHEFGEWFTSKALPEIVSFVTGTAWPAFKMFMKGTGQLALEAVIGLLKFGTWFLTDGLPAIKDFVVNDAKPALEGFFSALGTAWDTVKPKMVEMYGWFVYTAMPFISEKVAAAQETFNDLKEFLLGFWEGVQPGLNDFKKWFETDGLPAIEKKLGEAKTAVDDLMTGARDLWTDVQPGLNDFKNGVDEVMKDVKGFVQPVIDLLKEAKELYDKVSEFSGSVSNIVTEIGKDPRKAGKGIGGVVSGAIGSIFGRAGGGGMAVGQSYRVAEREPELFMPNVSGRMYNQQQLAALGNSIQLNGGIHIHANTEAEGAAGWRGVVNEAQRMGIQLVSA